MPRKKKPASGTTLVLRTCSAQMTGHAGFVWPRSGPVEAPDWNPRAECGNGLHGLLMGEGDGSLLDWGPDSVWLVVQVEAEVLVDLGGKVKFPRGEVVLAGAREDAIAYLMARGGRADKIQCGHASASGYQGQASASGYQGQASASGTTGQASASGTRGQASASGTRGQASASGYQGQASASGTRGQASASGPHGLSIAEGAVAAGDKGTICARWWDGQAGRYRYTIGYIGEDGIEPYFWYHLDAAGIWRKGEPIPDSMMPAGVAR